MFNVAQTTTVPIRPSTELPLLLRSLEVAGMRDSNVHRSIERFVKEAEIAFVVHASLGQKDLDAFGPLVRWLEDPVDMEISYRNLWKLHGAFDQFYRTHRPDCSVSEGVWEMLTRAVGDLDRPPG